MKINEFICLVIYGCFVGQIMIVSCQLNRLFLYSNIFNARGRSSVAHAKDTLLRVQPVRTQDIGSGDRSKFIRHMAIKNRFRSRSIDPVITSYFNKGRKPWTIQSSEKFSIAADRVDPDAKKNLTELIISEGYPCERFTVQTQDGFLLDLHHISHGRHSVEHRRRNASEKTVVYLQHGLLSSACDWLMNFANGSLGFILADAGYDVWLGNTRGNTYSRKHIKYTPDEAEFWDWSFDEMAKYDTTAFIDFILNKTGQPSLHYIGHSQGTTMAFALLSQNPDYQRKIRLFVGLAPVTCPAHAKSPIKLLSHIPDEIIYSIFGRKDFLPNDFWVKFAVDNLCTDKATRWICDNILLFLSGPDVSNLNQSRLDVYMDHTPAGASVKDLIHFSQVYREKKFQMYNFGSAEKNEEHYGQPNPPEYDVTQVKVPSVLFSGGKDWLAVYEDVKKLNSELPNVKSWNVIPKWDHLDFVWGEHAASMCYRKVLYWLSKF